MKLKENKWEIYTQTEEVTEKVTIFKDVRSWDTCNLPLCVGLMKKIQDKIILWGGVASGIGAGVITGFLSLNKNIKQQAEN